MAIEAIGGNPASSSRLNMQDFLKVLLTQLNYQDPMKPVDNQQFMAQMAQFTSLEQTQQLNSKLDQLISTQSSLQSVGLIGRTVDVAMESGTASGTVRSLSLNGAAPQLTVQSASGEILTGITLSQISAVR